MLKKVVFSVLAVILFITCIEFSGQFLYFTSHHHRFWQGAPEVRFTRFTPYGLYEHIPNSQIEFANLNYPASKLGIDRYGFVHNGEDRPIRKEDFVILLLGGSTVEGRGATSNKATAAAFLERQLNKMFPGRSIRVLNAGHSGYIAYQEFCLLSGKLLPEFHPDLVAALDGRNDASNVIQYADHGWRPYWQPYYDEITNQINFLMRQGGPTPLDFLSNRIKKYSILASLLDRWIRNSGLDSRYPQDRIPDSKQLDQAVNSYFEIQQLNFEVCRLKGIPYHAFLQPVLLESKKVLTPKEKALQKDWNRYYRKEIYWPSLNEIYKRFAGKETPFFYFHDLSNVFSDTLETVYWDSCHYSDLGNQRIAEAMARILEPEIRNRIVEKSK